MFGSQARPGMRSTSSLGIVARKKDPKDKGNLTYGAGSLASSGLGSLGDGNDPATSAVSQPSAGPAPTPAMTTAVNQAKFVAVAKVAGIGLAAWWILFRKKR